MGQLIGCIYKDARIQKSDNGSKFMVFTLVEKYSYKNKEGRSVTQNTYFNCIMWDANTLAPYLKKGTQIVLMGNITPHLYTNGQGKPKACVNVSVETLRIIPSLKPELEEKPTPGTESQTAG